MPTYPVVNKETGEKKELSMSMVAYDEWRKENPGWDKDCLKDVLASERLVSGETNSLPKILVGTMFYIRHLSLLAQELKRLTSNGKKKRFSYRRRNDG